MNTNKLPIFITYLDLEVKVIAPKTWHKYFFKLYKNSSLITCSIKLKDTASKKAILTINEISTNDLYLKFNHQSKSPHYMVDVSPTPLFLIMSIHQLISRILNIIFHKNGGFVLHASSAIINNQAYIFTGLSGVGKTTIANHLRKLKNVYVFSDNSAFISQKNNQFIIHPSPYFEVSRFNEFSTKFPKSSYPIKSIYFPKQSKKNKLVPSSFENSITRLKENSHIPLSADVLFSTKEQQFFSNTIFNFLDKIQMNTLEFKNDSSFIKLLLK